MPLTSRKARVVQAPLTYHALHSLFPMFCIYYFALTSSLPQRHIGLVKVFFLQDLLDIIHSRRSYACKPDYFDMMLDR
ncbi:hypothetical protein BDZ91DRAFT_755208 [Kalaharituber pfeilii]|nr:hypothetical protein BDZ91DRAFT_755208 [Kalaharituber pfeilii]